MWALNTAEGSKTMIEKLHNDRYEVEDVEGAAGVFWVYDYKREKGATVAIEKLSAMKFAVTNEQTGSTHTVENGRCDCPAGSNGRTCYHQVVCDGAGRIARRKRNASVDLSPKTKPRTVKETAPAINAFDYTATITYWPNGTAFAPKQRVFHDRATLAAAVETLDSRGVLYEVSEAGRPA